MFTHYIWVVRSFRSFNPSVLCLAIAKRSALRASANFDPGFGWGLLLSGNRGRVRSTRPVCEANPTRWRQRVKPNNFNLLLPAI